MSDTYNPLSFIFSDDPKTGAPTYEQLAARRRIAAALATRNRGFPKNIGEGLTYLGESLGDAMAERRSIEDEARYNAGISEKIRGALGPMPSAAPAAPAAPVTPPAPGPMGDIDPLGVTPDVGVAPAAPRPTPVHPNRPPLQQAQAAPAVQLASLGGTAAPTERQRTEPPFEPLEPDSSSMSKQMPIMELKQRLARNETGGQRDPYRAIGEQNRRGDFPYGKYQVMGENIPEWSKQYLGKKMTPNEFLNDPQAQEEIASARAGYYLNKYGSNGAAAAWFAGEHGMNDPRRRDTLGTHVAEYVRRFNIPLASRDDVTRAVARGGGGQGFGGGGALGAEPVAATREDIVQAIAPEEQAQAPQQMAQMQQPPAAPIQRAPPVGTPVPTQTAPMITGRPPAPPQTPPSQEEMRLQALIMSNPTDPRIQAMIPLLQQYQERRKFQDTRAVEDWKIREQEYTKRSDPQYQTTLEKSQQEAATRARERQREIALGGVPQELINKKIETSEKAVAPLREASNAINQVEDLLNQGMFTGLSGKAELALAKAKMAMGGPVDPRVQATEQFTASIKPITAAARAALVGGANISDKDLAAAEAAAGGDITLTEQGIRSIMKSLRTIQLQTAEHHQKMLNTASAGDPTAERTLNGLYGLPMENIIPKDHATVKRLMQNPNEHEKGLFDAAWYTPGLSDRIIARSRRR